jgi:hypothetical protein
MAVRKRYTLEPEDQVTDHRLRLEIEDWREHPDDDSPRIEIKLTDPASRLAEEEFDRTLWVTRDELFELGAISRLVLGDYTAEDAAAVGATNQ